jgi:hypothetical protein
LPDWFVPNHSTLISLKGKSMSGYLTRRDTIAVMVMQAIIVKREVLRLTPQQAALSALEHADALLETMGSQQRKTRKPSSNPMRINGNIIKL